MAEVSKADLVTEVANKAGVSKADAKKTIEATLETIQESLEAGGKVRLIGFGTFETGTRNARTGRNPQTGEAMEIPAAKTVKFKAGKQLKDAVANS